MNSRTENRSNAEPDGRGRRRALAVLLVAASTIGVVVLAGAWAATVAPDPPSASPAAAEQRTAVCTFTNPAYSGECVESTTIAEDSTAKKACQAILDCLNNPRCVTTYCNSSTLRSGWVLKKSEEN